MAKEAYYDFVSKKECKPYRKRTTDLCDALIKRLSSLEIEAKRFIIGSAGKRNLVTILVKNGKKPAIDVDINLEILTKPKKYKNPCKLKELIRSELNKIIKEKKEKFRDGQNSSSVITVPSFSKQNQLEFSFDIAIVSRNRKGNLQRLVLNKKNNNYTWNQIFGTSDFEQKENAIKKSKEWDKLRKRYLEIKTQYINDENHPSFICYKIAVEEIFGQQQQQLKNKKVSKLNVAKIIECLEKTLTYDNCQMQLNRLYQKGLISKPDYEYEFPTPDKVLCECYIDSLENLEGYDDYGIGEGASKEEAKRDAVYDMLCIFYPNEDDNDDEDDYVEDDCEEDDNYYDLYYDL